MKKNVTAAAVVILLAIMIISLSSFLKEQMDYKKAAAAYEEMNEEYLGTEAEKSIKEDNKNKKNVPVSFRYEEMIKKNPNVEGYIYLPDSNISYPIVRFSDNSYYLTHDALNNYSINGSVFIDCTNEEGLDEQHCIIYGHHMDNGSMLADICKFSDESFAKKHTEFIVFNKNVRESYTVISSFVTSPDNKNVYTTNFGSSEEYQKWIDYCISNSSIDYERTVTAADKTILLSTCTNRGNTRSVVVIKKNAK